jgi:3,4-dihydroxy-2-butanone 4-phosphate synthase
LIPSATIVETLSDSFNSMTLEESKKYADEHNIVLINGKEIIDDFNKTDRVLQ